jgi:hypothetical protein
MLSVAPISMVRDRLCLSGATCEAPSIGEGDKDVSMRRRRDGFLAHLMMRIPFSFARILRMLGKGRSQNDAIIGGTACTCMLGAPLVMVGGRNPSSQLFPSTNQPYSNREIGLRIGVHFAFTQ